MKLKVKPVWNILNSLFFNNAERHCIGFVLENVTYSTKEGSNCRYCCSQGKSSHENNYTTRCNNNNSMMESCQGLQIRFKMWSFFVFLELNETGTKGFACVLEWLCECMNSTADVLLPEEDRTEEAFMKPPLLHLDRRNGSGNRRVL